MTDGDQDAKRRTLFQALKVLGVVAAVGVVVWRVPLGSDEAPPTPTTSPVSQTTTEPRPEPDAPRFSPGELDDEAPVPEGMVATDGAWDGDAFWVLDENAGRVASVDPESGEVRADIELTVAADTIVAAPDGVWITTEGGTDVTAIDLSTGTQGDTVSLPDGADVAEIVALPESAWVRSSDGTVVRVANGTADAVTGLTGAAEGRFATDLSELWVMPVEGSTSAIRVDPVDLQAAEITLSAVGHEATVGGFADGEFFVAGPFELGSMISAVNPANLTVYESQQLSGTVEYLGWVAGSFGVLDPEGRLVRLRPIAIDGERLRTNWDGTTPLFPVEREAWTIVEDGTVLQRILITGIAD